MTTPDTPAALEWLDPFDPTAEPPISAWPEDMRLQAIGVRLLHLANMAAEVNYLPVSRAYRAERLARLAEFRESTIELLLHEAKRQAARSLEEAA